MSERDARKYYRDLPQEDRAEIEAAVVAAFTDDDGFARPTSEAKELFVKFIESARQAGRGWAEGLWDAWAAAAAGLFARDLWKRRDGFTTTVQHMRRVRTMARGTSKRTDEGVSQHVQESLIKYSVQQLVDAITGEDSRMQESRINRITYTRLLELCLEQECDVVDDALTKVGMSLDEYLESKDAA